MRFNKESGQALLITAFALVVLAGFTGLAVDMGSLRFQKRLQQSAADAAALAGASEINYSGLTTAAQTAATKNGFTDGSSSDISQCDVSVTSTIAIGTTCVQVNNPPPTGGTAFAGNTITDPHHAGDSNYVEVFVVKVQPTFFMNLFGVSREAVLARAVATNTGGGTAGGAGCIYTLGTPTNKIKLSTAGVGANGNAVLNGPTCGIVDNGNLDAVGSVQVLAGSIGVGGQSSLPSQQPSSCTPGVMPSTGVCPVPVDGMPYSGDPLAGKYTFLSSSSPGTSTTTTQKNGVQVTTFTPGQYSNLTVNSNSNDVFPPGNYVITGTFKINGGANVCAGGNATFLPSGSMTCTQDAQGDGVTFFLAGANASLSVNGTSNTVMYAPNSGTYEGLLFYQDPTNSNAATINGTDQSNFQGAIYMPAADLTFGGTSNFNNQALYTVIVTNQFDVAGNTNVNLASNMSGLASGGPLTGLVKWATLVE